MQSKRISNMWKELYKDKRTNKKKISNRQGL